MSSLVIHSGRVVSPSGVIEGGYVLAEGSRIVEVGAGQAPAAGRILDARGGWVMPGLIDLHCHGGGGRSFQEAEAEATQHVLTTHLRAGATSLVAAIAACGRDERHACLAALRAAPGDGVQPELLGAYLEGPYFSEKERGAQPQELIRPPDPADYLPTLAEFGGFIKVWALAPELPGALDFIRRLRAQGIVAALGHSDASDDAVEAAVSAGATLVTHVYCAQSTFHRVGAEKKLGLAEMALLLDELTVEVIADGKHLPPNLLRLVLKNKPPSRVCLITDAMPAAGMPPGEYQFLGDTVWVTHEVAYRADRQRYAGSVLTMAKAVANVRRQAGMDMAALAEMAALTPARLAGVADRKGTLEPGKDADIVVLDEALHVKAVVVRGQVSPAL